MKKIVKNKKGVSEVVGVIVMLGIAIALFSIVYIMAINFPFNEPNPSVRLSATIDDDYVIIVHQGGESLSLDTEVIFSVQGYSPLTSITINNMLDDPFKENNVWNIGEKASYDLGGSISIDLTNKEVRITVVDVVSNSIVMQGTVRGDNQP